MADSLELDNVIVSPTVEISCSNRFSHSRPSGFELVDRAENLDGDQRRHGNHGHDSERIPDNIAAHCLAGTHGEGKQERGGHGAGRDSAGVKRNRGEYFRYKK